MAPAHSKSITRSASRFRGAAADCRRAITVHLGGTMEEIAASEHAATHGSISEKPFVIVVQPSLFDSTRAPEGKHTAWAYCHVPNGSTVDMTAALKINWNALRRDFAIACWRVECFRPLRLKA